MQQQMRTLCSAGLVAFATLVITCPVGSQCQEAILLPPDEMEANQRFGQQAIAIQGDLAFVGARGNDTATGAMLNNAGAVFVYERTGSTWSLIQTLTASDAAADRQFGWELAVDGDTLAVGQNGHDVYIFENQAGIWVETASFTGSDLPIGGSFFTFGRFLDLSGDTLVVGARSHPETNVGDLDVGAVYVFRRSAGVWTESTILKPNTNAFRGTNFGGEIALDGDHLLVGAVHEDDFGCAESQGTFFCQGAVYAYQRDAVDPDIWNEMQIIDSEGLNFGRILAIDGTLAAAGHNGVVAVLLEFDNGLWSVVSAITGGGGGGAFGLAVNGDRIAKVDPAGFVGDIFVYTWDGMSLSPAVPFFKESVGSSPWTDSSIAMSVDDLITGWNDNGNIGAARIHRLDDDLDCNSNVWCDDAEIALGISDDCWPPTSCGVGGNGIPDDCDIAAGLDDDCNNNGIADDCDIACGALDMFPDGPDGIPDECQLEYVGPTNGTWFSAANWDFTGTPLAPLGGQVPDADNTALVFDDIVDVDQPGAVCDDLLIFKLGDVKPTVGTVNLNGGDLTANTIAIQDRLAALTGEGPIVCPEISNLGILNPFNTTTALIDITGTLTHEPTATLLTDLDGPAGHGRVTVSDIATTDGALVVSADESTFIPVPTTSFDVLSAPAITPDVFGTTGHFGGALLANISGADYLRVDTTPTTTTLVVDTLTSVADFSGTSPQLNGVSIPDAMVALDIDNDGDDDLALLIEASPGSVGILRNDTGDYILMQTLSVGNDPEALAIAALNADGFTDLVVANTADDTLQVLLNNGGVFTAQSAVQVGEEPVAIAAADFDGDTDIDLAVVSRGEDEIRIYDNDGNGGLTQQDDPAAVVPESSSIAVTDVNSDNAPDVIITTDAAAQYYTNDNTGNGTFTFGGEFTQVDLPTEVCPVDIDNDKDLDAIVIHNNDRSFSILTSDGTQLGFAANLPLPGAPQSVRIGDFDNDGDDDLAILIEDDMNARFIAILRNDTNGGDQITFTIAQQLPADSAAETFILADNHIIAFTDQSTAATGGKVLRSPAEQGLGGRAVDVNLSRDDRPQSVGPTVSLTSYINTSGPTRNCPTDCVPDNGDGTWGNNVVNIDDLVATINAFGPVQPATVPARCDVSPPKPTGGYGNGQVNIDDLLETINTFGPCPTPE